MAYATEKFKRKALPTVAAMEIDGGDTVGNNCPGPQETAIHKRNAADDDDSDNEGEQAALQNSGGGVATAAQDGDDDDSDNDAEEDGDDDGDDDSDGGEKPALAGQPPADGIELGLEGANDVATPATGANAREGLCLLVVTEFGLGLRMPLSSKKLILSRPGKIGKKVIKIIQKGRRQDKMVACCIVSNKSENSGPKVRTGMKIFMDEFRDNRKEEYEVINAAVAAELGITTSSAVDAPDAIVTAPASQLSEAEANAAAVATTDDGAAVEKRTGLAFKRLAAVNNILREKFRSLPEADQEVYQVRANEERQLYEEKVEEYRSQEAEEVLLGSTNGCISRLAIGSIYTSSTPRSGKILVKLRNENDSICAVSLLSAIEEENDEGMPQKQPENRPDRRRGGRPRGIAARASDGTAPVGSPLTGTSDGMSEKRNVLEDSARRLRGKQRTSIQPYLGKRAHLSRMATPRKLSSDNIAASPALNRSASRLGARLPIVKPKLRLLGKQRKRTMSINLEGLATGAAELGSPSQSDSGAEE